jgi:superfamily II DNA helicase RecQ
MSTLSQEVIILTSPPASGKTYWVARLQEALQTRSILVISPLRALADECRAKWQENITVMTPEEWLGKKVFPEIVIFDEFHLFFYWGDSFRPLMWEMFFEISLKTQTTFLLTATLSLAMREEVAGFATQFDSVTWHDHGNQILKFRPARYLKVPSRQWLLKHIKNTHKNKEVKLIFCKYRQEVFRLEEELTKDGFSCISCVGGESKFMAQKLEKNPRPDFIIATTVLSHGVNLPDIKSIFFLYEVQNLDFWIQMVARGGRRGESYEVYALEEPRDLKWNRVQNFFVILWLSFKQKFSGQSFPFLF